MRPLGWGAPGGSLLGWWEATGRPFAQLPRWGAGLVLALLVAITAWSASVTGDVHRLEQARSGPSVTAAGAPGKDKGQGDIALYSRISARVAAGEGYYAVATDEQRRAGYPTRPFVTVRLPTLAYLHLAMTPAGVGYLLMALLFACLLALPRALAGLTAMPERIAALVLLPISGAAVGAPSAALFHEVLAGLLLTLALLLHRRGGWGLALLAAGCALAVRELAVPFVLLWLVFALAGRRWREAAAVGALLAVFAGGMALHYLGVESMRLPGDPVSQGWNSRSGYALPLMAMARLTGLLLVPVWLAAPLAILPLVGWAAIGGRLGLFAVVWFVGMFTMVALFARPENFYWVQLTMPAYGLGLAFAPRGLLELWHSAAGRASRQT